MSGNFVIFEDQENLAEKSQTTIANAKKDRPKLAVLNNKAIFDENSLENQVRNEICRLKIFLCPDFVLCNFSQVSKQQKPSGSSSAIVGHALKQKNVFATKDEVIVKLKTKSQEILVEESIVNVTTDEAGWSAESLEASASFRLVEKLIKKRI